MSKPTGRPNGRPRGPTGKRLSEDHRETIRTTQLLNRLTKFCLGETNGKDPCELSPHQVTAILGLLRKALPDLAAVEHSGQLDLMCDLSAEPLAPDEWDRQYGAHPING